VSTHADVRRLGRRALSSTASRLALVGAALVCGLAIVGPFFAPYSPSELVSAPFLPPDAEFRLGTDYLGEDVLSRVMTGGWRLILLAVVATVLAYTLGTAIGLVAGYARTIADPLLMRFMDLMLAFPPLLLLLLLAAGFGASVPIIVLGIVLVQLPLVARVVRTATLETSTRGFVEAAVARGDRLSSILTREILPNIWTPISADAGPRFTISILLVAALNFLGLGVAPPTPDWAVMIAENRAGIELNVWALAVPAALIAVLTVCVNTLADAVARSLGSSTDERGGQR